MLTNMNKKVNTKWIKIKHKINFEVDGKEIEMRYINSQFSISLPAESISNPEISSISAQINEISQITQDIGKSLEKPYLTTVEKPDGLADAIEQKVSEGVKIRYEIL